MTVVDPAVDHDLETPIPVLQRFGIDVVEVA